MNAPQDSTAHWQTVYTTKSSTAVSWYSKHLDVSLRLLERGGLGRDSRIIDVGGGASTLVDDLLDRGVASITVLDLAAASLDVAKQRLGERAARVQWVAGDVTHVDLPPASCSHWHDRAVLHFLTEERAALAYAARAASVVAPGGYAVIGGFAPDGPERCSGLTVARRSAEQIAALMNPAFSVVETVDEQHLTPAGAEQAFVYVLLERR